MPSIQAPSAQSHADGYRARLCRRLARDAQARGTIWSPSSPDSGSVGDEDEPPMDNEEDEEVAPDGEGIPESEPLKLLLECVTEYAPPFAPSLTTSLPQTDGSSAWMRA